MNLETPERLPTERYMAPGERFRLFKHRIDYRVDVHWHEFFELALVESGAGTHVFNGVSVPLGRKSLFLLTPADFHEIVPDPGETVRLYNAIFVQQFIRPELFQWLIQDRGGFAVELTEAEHASLESEFARMWAETESAGTGADWVIAGTLERVLVDMMRAFGDGKRDLNARNSHAAAIPEKTAREYIHPSIRQAVTYLQYHFRDPVTLESVAKHAGLSANYFSECFSKQIGVPFQLYLVDLRLKFAHSLLGMTKLPITEICYASGFATLSHFERTFKAKYNRTPRQVRQEADDVVPFIRNGGLRG